MTTRTRPLALALALVLVAAACSPAPPPSGGAGRGAVGEDEGGEDEGGEGEGGEGEGGEAGGDEGGAGGSKEVAGEPKSAEGGAAGAELAEAAWEVLNGHCGGCHRGTHCSPTGGGFGEAFDVEAMIDCGRVVPGNASASPVWQRLWVTDGTEMPPQGRLSRAEKDAVRDWIDAGAPARPER
jgi:hypothetical protein